jgi:hypothetical protein
MTSPNGAVVHVQFKDGNLHSDVTHGFRWWPHRLRFVFFGAIMTATRIVYGGKELCTSGPAPTKEEIKATMIHCTRFALLYLIHWWAVGAPTAPAKPPQTGFGWSILWVSEEAQATFVTLLAGGALAVWRESRRAVADQPASLLDRGPQLFAVQFI